MKRLNELFNEELLVEECLCAINEGKDPIKLPYTFDIYNEGSKNVDYKITKSTIYKIFFSIDKNEEFDEKDGKKVVKFVDNHSQMIRLPLPANDITYKEYPNKDNTKNWTEIPEISSETSAGAWYSDKYVEYNYKKYNEDWNRWFKSLKPYMKGKISVTISDSGDKDSIGWNILEIKVNDDHFNKEREEKIKELQNPAHLKEWAEEADAKEKAEIKRREEEEARKKKAQEEWEKWWSSLSDNEKLSWTMGYGRNKYQGD